MLNASFDPRVALPAAPRLFADFRRSASSSAASLSSVAASGSSTTAGRRATGATAPAPAGSLAPSLASLVPIFEHAVDPTDVLEVRDLYIGRVEHELGSISTRPELAKRWRDAPRRRTFTEQDLLASSATRAVVGVVKEVFNWFFRDDVYGAFRSPDNLILSSGSVDATVFGLATPLKSCLAYALSRDWYGYSDSRGRDATRAAIAALENARSPDAGYDLDNVLVTLGGTVGISSIAEFLALQADHGGGRRGKALVALPNYPPLAEALALRFSVELAPLRCEDGVTRLDGLLEAIDAETRVVLLQTVTNPTGSRVDAKELARFLDAVPAHVIVLLDECHECLGPPSVFEGRHRDNLVRIKSLSKSHGAPGLKIGWMLCGSAFVGAFYEHASTSYGSPPSIFYLLLEVYARFEHWRLAGLDELGPSELLLFEAEYGLHLRELQNAYRAYCTEQSVRDETLIDRRRIAVARLAPSCDDLIVPEYSLNVLACPVKGADGYTVARRLLQQHRVAVYPGILAFCPSDGWVRVSPGVDTTTLDEGLARVARFAASVRAGRS